MSILVEHAVSAAIFATTKRGRLFSITFYSHTADVTVSVQAGGSSGTTVLTLLKDATTGIGDDTVVWKCGDPQGVAFGAGCYLTISGTTKVGVEYADRS